MLAYLLLMLAVQQAQTQSTVLPGKQANYMVLHPNRFDFDSTYTVTIRLLRPIPSLSVSATIGYENTTAKTNVTLASGNTLLSLGMEEGKIKLQLPERLGGYYRPYWLKVQGTGSTKFDHFSRLYSNYGHKPAKGHIFVQTDKGEYKTGQRVRYRVFVVDNELKPIDPEMDVRIKDPKGNIITEHSAVRAIMGMSGDLQLSEHPVLGMWKIEVKVKNPELQEIKRFSVNEYVLPKYEVKVELPPFGLVENPELKGKVIAKYTYGKPVKGHVTLRVSKGRTYWWFYEPRAIQTKFDIDGEAEFSIPMDTLLKFDPSLKYSTLFVEANVTESLTGTVRIASNRIPFHERRANMNFEQHHDYFKPGFRYNTHLKIEQPDGRPPSSYGEKVRISVTYFTDKPVSYRFQQLAPRSPTSKLMEFISPFSEGNVVFMPDMRVPIPNDGIVQIDLDIPEGVATGHIEAEALQQKATMNIERFRTISKAYLNLELKSTNLKVGDKAEFSISSTVVPRDKVTYYIINKRSEIIHSDFTSIYSRYSKRIFYVTITADMIPSCSIIAFFYHDSHREVIADGLTFPVGMTMKNTVGIEFDRRQVSPGSNVSLHLHADPGSQIFVLAVDKSTILHKRGNDITTDTVYRKIGIPNHLSQQQEGTKRLYGNKVGDLFDAVGLTILTDSNMSDFNLWALKRDINQRSGAMHGSSFSMDAMECNGPGCTADVSEMSGMQMMSYVRKDFPETWIWANESASASGRVDIHAEVPDTITEWVATAFALNKNSGIGVAPTPSNLTVFLPFFVSLQLPFSIVSGEIVIIQALVFNYFPYDMYVTVKLKNTSDDFVAIRVDHNGQEEEVKDIVENCILVKSDSAATTHFMIRAVTIGTIDLEVQALSTRGRDTVRRQLIVKPPGKEEEENTAILLSLDNAKSNQVAELPVFFPPRIVPESQRVRLSVIGDIFGSSLENMEHLVHMPDGCGEQNMVNFAPAVYAAQYMNVTNRYTGKIRERVLRAMTTGYQRELQFQRRDGSFSAFGQKDAEGSLWLTAFVVKSFAQANKYIFIDPTVVEEAINFTLHQQNPDGSFEKTGFVISKSLQGSSASSNRSIAAYVLLALMETQKAEIVKNTTLIEMLRKAILSTWSYVYQNKEQMNDDYEMAISAYALGLMGRGGSRDLVQRLDNSRTVVKNDGLKYWRDTTASKQVETASYALLAHAKHIDKVGGLPVLRWLVKQRNPFGGFESTQDTVVALQSLAEFAVIMYSKDVDMNITFESYSQEPVTINVNSENMDVLQLVDVASEQGRINVNATGHGMALVEASMFYNVLDEMKNPSFSLSVATEGNEIERFTIKTCARWLGAEDSGMVLMDIDFPSGFEPELPKYDRFDSFIGKKREIKDGRYVAYFDYLPSDKQVCVVVEAKRVMTVAKYQPAYVRVYSYYDTDKSAMKMYLPNTLKGNSICDVCDIECGCKYNPEAVPRDKCIMTSTRRIVSPFKTISRTIQVPDGTFTYPSGLLDSYPSWTRRRTVKLQNPWIPPTMPLFRRVWTSPNGI